MSTTFRDPKPPTAAPRRASDRIREAARELFYTAGIRAVGVEEIVTHAGVTKPSLYRSFASKDELAASYLRDYDLEFWKKFDAAADLHPGDPRAQILAFLTALSQRATGPTFRGCGLTNAAIEYPEPGHPARLVAENNKRTLRARLHGMARNMGARAPEELGDGLLLLIEGAYASSQLFGPDGPAQHVAEAAERLIDSNLA